jgi:N-acetylglucosamine kinase-like BadF-type ATPase
MHEYEIGAEAARLIFRVAQAGDPVACDLIRWAGTELGGLVNAVIRQLEFEELAFDIVMTGSMFDGGAMLIDPMRSTVHTRAPQARLVRLNVPPVIGAAMLGMEAAGFPITPEVRKTMNESISALRSIAGR